MFQIQYVAGNMGAVQVIAGSSKTALAQICSKGKSGVGVSGPTVICYFVKAIYYFYNMSSKYKFADNDKLYFVSFAITGHETDI